VDVEAVYASEYRSGNPGLRAKQGDAAARERRRADREARRLAVMGESGLGTGAASPKQVIRGSIESSDTAVALAVAEAEREAREEREAMAAAARPHYATSVKEPLGPDGRPVPVDRSWPRESPGPGHYSDGVSFEALRLGGVPTRKVGVKLTQAQRFAPDRRPDGSVVEHPYEAAHLAEQSNRLVVKKVEPSHTQGAMQGDTAGPGSPGRSTAGPRGTLKGVATAKGSESTPAKAQQR
jgi:hypothetical protein